MTESERKDTAEQADFRAYCRDWIAANHPYEEPELIVIPVSAGASAYLQWIRDHTG